MSYYFSTNIRKKFTKAKEIAIAELKNEGFGILTEINVKDTLKKKLDVDFRNYTILGACNPPFAYKALQVEDKVGAMLPCNVIVEEISEDLTEISVIDPMASMQSIENETLAELARLVQKKLIKVVENIN